MTRRIKTALFVATLWFSPAPALADGFLIPWGGVNFAHEPADGRASFGLSAGAMGGGVIGGEFDFGYSPNFFGTENTFGSNNVVTLMGNLIVGIPFGGTGGPGIRPYVVVGGGLIRSKIDLLGSEISQSDFGIDAGGGVMAFFSDRVGVRGDLRYFRVGFNDVELFDFDEVDFWRASIGLVIR